MAASIRVLGIPGSLRKQSFNRALLRAAQELAPAAMSIEIYEGLADIPPYNTDVEEAGMPEAVTRFVGAIAAADALLVATPEYNYGVPGVLKNAIDWASRPPARPLRGKPAAILGASTGAIGTARAQLGLRQTFLGVETYAMLKPEIYVARAADKFDAEGRLVDEPTREVLLKFLVAFAAWISRLRG